MNAPTTLGRNDRCHCGSGKKYKQCCLDKDAETLRARRAESAPAADEAEASGGAAAPVETHVKASQPRQKIQQPWNRSPRGGQSFARVNAPRKTGGGG